MIDLLDEIRISKKKIRSGEIIITAKLKIIMTDEVTGQTQKNVGKHVMKNYLENRKELLKYRVIKKLKSIVNYAEWKLINQ